MIGTRVAYQYYVNNERIEGDGTIIDKVRTTDRIFNDEGEVKFVSPHDIYLVKNGAGEVTPINPFNIVKIIE